MMLREGVYETYERGRGCQERVMTATSANSEGLEKEVIEVATSAILHCCTVIT